MTVILSGTTSLSPGLCQPARSMMTAAWLPSVTWKLISFRCSFVAFVLACGERMAAPLPSAGHTAPKIYAHWNRWSFKSGVLDPLSAQMRVSLPFWPILASS